ncbi:uncharacterized protein LOC129612537 [Condylostylus longicornis]|uniref:uncharacterized protein LOC129612537 n=1 Tax=Condylostylus longicornis TaxID=2530218 RepID=UPI00244E07B9|nr:uncharacterized protein LOC129612537 [Condylostylus longicornis]
MSVDLSTLIKLVKQRPEIYSRHFISEEFNNSWRAKEAAWEDVSKKICVDVNILKKKWRTLRDQFQRHYKRIQASNGSKIEIHWPYFEKLLFLKDHCKSKDLDNQSFKFVKNEDEDTQTSHFDIDTEDTFETLNDGGDVFIDNRDGDDFYVVTTSAEQQNDEDVENEKIQKICDSNTVEFDSVPPPPTSRSKRKYDEKNSNDKITIKKSKFSEAFDDDHLDRQISDCLDTIKNQTQAQKDHIDHFSNFIASMMRQWSQKRQCEAMNYFTNYVMENHIRFKQDKE